MTTETYLTQPNAARFLEEYFKMHGKSDPRNFQYLLNDQRRERYADPIPHLKVKGRILYSESDLQRWAAAEVNREKARSPGIYEVEGCTSLERLVKLSVAVATMH